jgi:alcohol dehydrogenase class IV
VPILEFSVPTKVEFGIDAVARLGYFASKLGSRAVLVCDNFLRHSVSIHTIEDILKGKGIESIVYDAVYPNADSRVVDEIALIARRARTDIVVGIGGSRVINIAKLVAFLCANEGDLDDYLHGREGGGGGTSFIAIPTLFREVYALTDSAFLTDVTDQRNKVLTLRGMGTDVLMIDPVLMSDIPLNTAVYTCLDILSLSIEGYISLKINPLIEPVLLRGIEIVFYNLMNYINNPQNVTVREKLCTAGFFTALASGITGFGLNHALSMGMNGKNRISKSITSSLLLPHMMEYNITVAAKRFAKIARVMGKDVRGREETEAAYFAIEGMNELKQNLQSETTVDLASTFMEIGIEKDDLAEAAEVAIRFEDVNSVPRKASFENLMEILIKAF